jgi:serine phosphatase RsbU (regulator of sigma subunit)/CheY-like chemotaxis protein
MILLVSVSSAPSPPWPPAPDRSLAATATTEPASDEEPIGRLLLVEDDDADAFLVCELIELGQPGLEVTRVCTLEEACAHLANPRVGFDVVVLDLGLPDAEGLDIVPRIVATAPAAAVVVLTGLCDEDRGVAAVAAGAQDYLTKGQVDERSLRRAVTYAIGRKRVEETTRRMVEWEAQKRQNVRLERGLLPTPLISGRDWAVRTGYCPGQHRSLLGGDFFDAVQLPDRRLHLVVGDVAGHGPDEAALGVLLRAAWRTLVLARTPPEDLLPKLTLLLESERPSEEVFATALYVVLEPGGATAVVVNAGHPPPVSVSAAPARAWILDAGPPLGVVDRWEWPTQHVPMAGLCPLLLYTDGLIEGYAQPSVGQQPKHLGPEVLTTPGAQERLGEEGLLELVRQERSAGTDELIPRLIQRAEDAHGDALPDDVALLLVEPGGICPPPAASSASKSGEDV